MRVEDAVMKIKAAGRDNSYAIGTDRCIEFLNRANYEVNSVLIANKYPNIVKTALINNGDSLPKNCMHLCGSYPMCTTEGTVELFDDVQAPLKIRYFSLPDDIVKTQDTMPYANDALNDIVVQGAIILALRENSVDISAEIQFKQAVTEAVAAAMKA